MLWRIENPSVCHRSPRCVEYLPALDRLRRLAFTKQPGVRFLQLMKASQIENIVVDEANQRTYVVLASTVLSDGEIYRAIRQEILRRGGVPLARGETLTLTLTPGGRWRAHVDAPEPVASGLPGPNQGVWPEEKERPEAS